MKKKIAIIAGLAIIFAAAVILGLFYFNQKSEKKKITIESSALVENNIDSEINSEELQAASQPDEAPAQDSEIQSNASVSDDNSAKTESISASDKAEAASKEPENSAPDFKIINKPVNWGFQKASGRNIDTVIIHSSYNVLGGDPYSLDKILDIYKSYGVAPHYIISRDGKVYRLVEDKNITYHAGESKVPDGRTGVNNFSVGIEIINSKTEGPSGAQYESLKGLIGYLKGKYKIKYVLGHKDIAPGRKDDPWKFDWKKIK